MIAILVILVPLVLGFLLKRVIFARLGQNWRFGVRLWAYALSIALAGVGCAVMPMGIWDRMMLFVLFGLGFFAGGLKPGTLLITGVSVIFSIMALEVGVRIFMPKPPSFPQHDKSPLILDAATTDHIEFDMKEMACKALYSKGFPRGDRLARPLRNRKRVVLQLGDSMLYGLGVDDKHTLTQILNRMDPNDEYINAGFPDTGPDFHLLMIRRWVDVIRPDAVVLYLWVTNDLFDINQPYPCCENGPLLKYTRQGPIAACKNARWVHVPTWMMGLSSAYLVPPYIFRATTGVSYLSRYMCAVFYGLSQRAVVKKRKHGFDAQKAFESIMQAFKKELSARGIPLIVVLMPVPPWLMNGLSDYHARVDGPIINSVCKKLGIKTLDPGPDFFANLRADTLTTLFETDEYHYSAKGNRRLAAWLKKHMVPLLSSPASSR